MIRSRVIRPVGLPVLLLAASYLALSGCSMPSMPTLPGMAGYYVVTDPVRGTEYYTDRVRREQQGVVEFRDGATGAWVSIPDAELRAISAAEFRDGTRR